MKIVIAPDSFKDSLSAEKVANAIAAGLADALPDAQLVTCPMADGGEGTVEAIVAAGNGAEHDQADDDRNDPARTRGFSHDFRLAFFHNHNRTAREGSGRADRQRKRQQSG